MPSIQHRNNNMPDILMPDVIRNGYRYMHEPIGDFGIWNGQFQLGGDPFPEGWELWPTGTIVRDTGGWAGNYCLKGGNAGTGIGGYVNTLRYFPVNDTDRDYYISCVARGSTANTPYNMGAYCYDANKNLLGVVWTLAAPETTPGVAWVRRQRKIGPNGDIAWPANTRYCRPCWGLQTNQGLTGEYIWIDDCQFHQLEMTYSPQIRLTHGQSYDYQQDFTKQAWTLWAGSQINLTLEEPGYIHYCYTMWGRNRTHGARTDSWSGNVFIGGVQQTQVQTVCSPGVDHNMPATLCGISDNIIPIGAVTVDLRIWVHNAGDNIRMRECNGWAWYTRAY